MCEFDFNGLWAIPVFTITIQIHPDFSKYFSAEDMAQVSTVRIDPATLILTSVDDTLSIDDIDNESAPPSYAGQIADQIFWAIYLPIYQSMIFYFTWFICISSFYLFCKKWLNSI